MREVNFIPEDRGHYMAHTESGSWHYLDLDLPLRWLRLQGAGAIPSQFDYLDVTLQALAGGWELGGFGHLIPLKQDTLHSCVTYVTSRIRGLVRLDEDDIDPRISKFERYPR
jgi:hypothetical protein